MASLNRYLERHLEGRLCQGGHCRVHQVDELAQGHYRRCGECGHVFQTGRELEREHDAIVDAWNGHTAPYEAPFWGVTRERLRHRKARDIDECPLCHHVWSGAHGQPDGSLT